MIKTLILLATILPFNTQATLAFTTVDAFVAGENEAKLYCKALKLGLRDSRKIAEYYVNNASKKDLKVSDAVDYQRYNYGANYPLPRNYDLGRDDEKEKCGKLFEQIKY